MQTNESKVPKSPFHLLIALSVKAARHHHHEMLRASRALRAGCCNRGLFAEAAGHHTTRDRLMKLARKMVEAGGASLH